MKNRHYIPPALCPDQIDQTTQLINWCSLLRETKNNQIEFNHADSCICGVILGRELYESAEAYSSANPQYKSFSNMVEFLIWRELGSRPEFLQSTSPSDQDYHNKNTD